MNRNIKTCVVAMLGAACLTVGSNASAILVTGSGDATTLANAILGGGGAGVDLSSVSATLSGHSLADGEISSGTYTNASGTYGIGAGVVLSSGDVNDYNDGPNNSSGNTTSYNVPATAAQEALLDPITGGSFDHFDVTQLDITFDMLPGFDTVFFNMVFGSEEFDEFVGSSFIDGFGLFVNGTNIAFVDGDPVNINHPDMGFFPGTELDGILGGSTGSFGQLVHTFSSAVNPTGNMITFIVADTSDTVLDTTVYLSQLGGTAPEQVPEPASLALMGLGLAGLGFMRRNSKRA